MNHGALPTVVPPRVGIEAGEAAARAMGFQAF